MTLSTQQPQNFIPVGEQLVQELDHIHRNAMPGLGYCSEPTLEGSELLLGNRLLRPRLAQLSLEGLEFLKSQTTLVLDSVNVMRCEAPGSLEIFLLHRNFSG
jgi:hypothetical protein